MARNRSILAVSLTAALIGVVAYLLGRQPESEPGLPAQVAAAEQPQPAAPLIFEAQARPASSAELSVPLSGIPVAAILVGEGDRVAAGDPLLRLDTRGLLLEVDEARAALSRATAEYDGLFAGADPAEVTAAQAQLDEALARLQQAQSRVTTADLSAATASLEQAQARLRELEAGPRQADIVQARAELSQMQARLAQRRIALSAAKEDSRRLMEERANDLRAAQAAVVRASEERRRTAGDDAPGRAAADALARAELALANAELALERARVEYDARRQDEVAGLAEDEAQVTSTQAQLDALLAGPRADELAGARAQVTAAEATIARLSGDERSADVAAASAAAAQARARLDGLTSGPAAADLARLKAAVEESSVRLRQAELRLEQATLVAPIDGIIAVISVAPGETPDARAIVVVVADTSAWHVEAQNLTDLEVVRIQAGDPVTISVYAVPGLDLPGRVARIQPLGRSDGRSMRYTAVIVPERWDERVRWGMLAQVRMQISEGGTAGE